jgi:DNA-binding MarR family transcriptional regulator
MTSSRSEIQALMRQWREVMASSRPRWSAADLTFTQLRALSVISRREAVRVSDLAEELGVGLAAASALVDRMARRQFITRHADPNDRRIVLLELGARGRQLLERLERGSTERFGKLIARMTPAERDALATTLRAFVRLSAEHTLRKDAHGLVVVQRVAKC